ncbi:hypothetical protein GCM10007879_30350 [Maritalea porphyrae]|uniref:Uncharacterized protein n=1 Tax=Maritalea porphyrae TaxID=880732 RepID=A0ABQ5UWL5_9HYPH|nr:hypothetical protein GCM10007879_30350 [Maritalea porphyrae]
MIIAMAAMNKNVKCHVLTMIMTCPKLGAIMGIAMKIIMINDMISAIARPSNLSRTIEVAMTRDAPAPNPWKKRKAKRVL